MKQHKWHKEIKAWADGAEIECQSKADPDKKWQEFDGNWGEIEGWKFRIKPQPKEPQYLYVFDCEACGIVIRDRPIGDSDETYKGKIPLITETDDGA